MKTGEKIIVELNGKSYSIVLFKLVYVLSRLENKKIALKGREDIDCLLNKYKLFDEVFLNNINQV